MKTTTSAVAAAATVVSLRAFYISTIRMRVYFVYDLRVSFCSPFVVYVVYMSVVRPGKRRVCARTYDRITDSEEN